jgi:uncharacterized protein (DUF1697 family)
MDSSEKIYKTSASYLALFRGINVGGNNIIKMVDLKSSFTNMGFEDVETYIQSGNVLFKYGESDKVALTNKIEKQLSDDFNYNSKIVLITLSQLKAIVEKAPPGFGSAPDEYRYDVIFLKEPLTTVEAMESIKIREGVDNVYPGKNVIYFSRLISRASQSYLSKIITLPVYKKMTIRNWNTTTKLLMKVAE